MTASPASAATAITAGRGPLRSPAAGCSAADARDAVATRAISVIANRPSSTPPTTMSGSIRPSGSAIAATANTTAPAARPTTARVLVGRNKPSLTRTACRASTIGAAESQASIVASPNAASKATPHRIGRTMTSQAALTTAPPSVSSSSRWTMYPPTTSRTPTASAAHMSDRPAVAAVRQRFGDRAMAAAKQTRASTGSSHASTPRALATAIVVSAKAWSPIEARVTETSDVTAARSGATAANTAVTTAAVSARRRATESASLSVRAR